MSESSLSSGFATTISPTPAPTLRFHHRKEDGCAQTDLFLFSFLFLSLFYTFLGRQGGRERCCLHLRRRLVRLSFPCDGVRFNWIQLKTYTYVYIAFYPCILHQYVRFYIKIVPTHRASPEDNIVRGRWFKKAVQMEAMLSFCDWLLFYSIAQFISSIIIDIRILFSWIRRASFRLTLMSSMETAGPH